MPARVAWPKKKIEKKSKYHVAYRVKLFLDFGSVYVVLFYLFKEFYIYICMYSSGNMIITGAL